MWNLCNFGFVAWLDAALLRYINLDPDHSVIITKTHRGDHLAQSCTVPQQDWNGKRGSQLPAGHCWCLICGIAWSPHNFGSVTWLGAALLRYVNSDPDNSVIINKMHRWIVFLKTAPIPQDGRHFERVWGGLQFTSVQCWCWFVGWNAPHATLALWLSWMHHYYNTG